MSDFEIREHYLDDPLLPKLFLQSWRRKSERSLGCVLITHGLAEHGECYDHVAKALANQGWLVFAWDLQGHGRSQGRRGYIREFSDFRRDLGQLIDKLKNDSSLPTSQLHLIGHSMGGLITLDYLTQEGPSRVQSASLSNPALAVALEVPRFKHLASELLKSFWPSLTLDNEVRYERLSRDPDKVASYSKDPLRHTKISAPLYLGMLETMKDIKRKPESLRTPVFFQISGQDQIVSAQASLDYFKSLSCEKKLKIYENSYHEVYNDLDQEEAIDDLIAFLGEFKK